MNFKTGIMVAAVTLALPLVFSGSVLGADSQPKFASGKVKDGASFANNASVTATCNGHNAVTSTDAGGNFTATFASGDCTDGQTVTVFASLNGKTGSDSKTAGSPAKVEFGTIFLQESASVPEFGLVTGAVALLGSAGAFVAMKKRA